ncbi:hypothetical protein TRVA0_002S01508 [Trichomonascus vanleenenianus]|uniref:uncharacterized protein n=1 Tax=Trichomonascus vanleenenianus TaxID=2268995 RepID=UPI003ECA85BB
MLFKKKKKRVHERIFGPPGLPTLKGQSVTAEDLLNQKIEVLDRLGYGDVFPVEKHLGSADIQETWSLSDFGYDESSLDLKEVWIPERPKRLNLEIGGNELPREVLGNLVITPDHNTEFVKFAIENVIIRPILDVVRAKTSANLCFNPKSFSIVSGLHKKKIQLPVHAVTVSRGLHYGMRLYFNLPTAREFSCPQKELLIHNFLVEYNQAKVYAREHGKSRFLITDYYITGIFDLESGTCAVMGLTDLKPRLLDYLLKNIVAPIEQEKPISPPEGELPHSARTMTLTNEEFKQFIPLQTGYHYYSQTYEIHTKKEAQILKIFDPEYYAPDEKHLAHQLYTIETRAYQALENLQGKHIPKLYSHGVIKTEEFCCFYILIERIFGKKPLPDDPVQYEAAKRALEQIHACGIAHGDIRTYNMFVVKDQVKMIDFGFSVHNEDRRFNDLIQQDLSKLQREFSSASINDH